MTLTKNNENKPTKKIIKELISFAMECSMPEVKVKCELLVEVVHVKHCKWDSIFTIFMAFSFFFARINVHMDVQCTYT